MLSAGEASGDLHGARLIEAIRKARPSAEFFGMGGAMMEKAGMELLFNPTEIGAFGIVEVIRLLPLAAKIRRMLLASIRDRRPDVLVLIDFPGFNLKLAEASKALGVKCIYYFSPSAWAWGRGRAKRVARCAYRVASVFPFEEEVYRQAGAQVVFVGHPLKDIVGRSLSDAETALRIGVEQGKPIVALCPGSRGKEVASLFPIMLQSASLIAEEIPGCQFVCPVAPTIPVQVLRSMSDGLGVDIRYYADGIHDLFGITDLAIIASGTATLEAAIVGTPMVIVYKVANLTYRLGKLLVKIPNIGLPNIVAGRRVVPELLQNEANPQEISQAALQILKEPARTAQMKKDLAEVSDRLGDPGAVDRAARLTIDVAEGSVS